MIGEAKFVARLLLGLGRAPRPLVEDPLWEEQTLFDAEFGDWDKQWFEAHVKDER